MWFIIALTLLNALANNKTFVLEYRVSLGGVPLNIFDAALGFALIAIAIRPRGSELRTERIHPLFMWIIILFVLALIGGLIAAVYNSTLFRYSLAATRNFVALPICVAAGYYLIPHFRAVQRFVSLQVIAGLLAAIMILLFFRGQAEVFRSADNINKLRTVDYISSYAGVAAAVLLFTVLTGVRLLPRWLAITLASVCLLGQFATLSRSDWIAETAAIGSMYFLLPKERRSQKIIVGILLIPVVIGSLWFGVYMASRVTGLDFYAKMETRVKTMLPGGERTGDLKVRAWDTRVGGIFRELNIWIRSPLFGQGLGIQEAKAAEFFLRRSAYRHNTWTSFLAETGLIGFTACTLMVGSCIVVGRRLARDQLDQSTVLMGAVGVATGVTFLLLGLMTMSFNQMRPGIPLALVCGAVLRTRAMQLGAIQQWHATSSLTYHALPLEGAPNQYA